MEKLLTSEDVSNILGVSKKTVCYTLNLPYIKIAGKRMYTVKDIENFIQKNKNYTIDIKPFKNKKVNYVV